MAGQPKVIDQFIKNKYDETKLVQAVAAKPYSGENLTFSYKFGAVTKPQPKVYFVRSGARWGVFVGGKK